MPRSATGRGKGVTPVARFASVSTITTVRNASARRRAVTITWKHSSMVAGAIRDALQVTGESPAGRRAAAAPSRV
jgi:hypothetical protein